MEATNVLKIALSTMMNIIRTADSGVYVNDDLDPDDDTTSNVPYGGRPLTSKELARLHQTRRYYNPTAPLQPLDDNPGPAQPLQPKQLPANNVVKSDETMQFVEMARRIYDNLPDYIWKNSIKNGPIQIPRMYNGTTKYTEPVPEDMRKIISQLITNAMMRTKVYIDISRQRKIDNVMGDPKRQKLNAHEVKTLFVNQLKSLLVKQSGIDKYTTSKILSSIVNGMDDRQFQIRVGDADEMMRFYQYEENRKRLFGDTPFEKLNPEQMQQIANVTNQNLGYDSGAAMYIRKQYPKGHNRYDKKPIDEDLTKVHHPMTTEERQKWLLNELSNFQGGKSGRNLAGTLPYDSPYFRQYSKQIQELPQNQPQQQSKYRLPSLEAQNEINLRICIATQYIEKISTDAEQQGDYIYADYIDGVMRTACKSLMS